MWWCAALLAADVEGVILVTRKLTRHRVTPVGPAPQKLDFEVPVDVDQP